MQLKRKRSTDTSSSKSPFSATSNTTITTPGSGQSHSPSPFQAHSTPHQTAGVNSRTLKRHRDNRPSEDMIHQKTMQKLYAAQRGRHDVEPIMSAPLESAEPQAQVGAPAGQKSLEAFWRIPASLQGGQTQAGTIYVGKREDMRCEDCDAPMKDTHLDGDWDFDMLESLPLEVKAHSGGGECYACEKMICGLCSVVREHRVCFDCTDKGWE